MEGCHEIIVKELDQCISYPRPYDNLIFELLEHRHCIPWET